MDFSFRFPGVFTFLSFGIYATMLSATIYVNGTNGGRRMGDILWYNYVVWLTLNVFYWVGWIRKKLPEQTIEQWRERTCKFRRWGVLLYCMAVGVILAAWIYHFDLRELSSYKAYRDCRQGWAQQYAREWEERLEVLHDDTVQEVEFYPLSVLPETITYADLQPPDGYIWVNHACAAYYGKSSVTVIVGEQE